MPRLAVIILPGLFALAGCAELGLGKSAPEPAPKTPGVVTTSGTPAPATRPATTSTAVIAPTGTSVAALDTTSAADKAAASAAGAAGGGASLGSTVASLGAAAEGGLWLKTPLVKAPAKGRVVDKATGKAVAVNLLPLPGGGGAQLSLAAMQALGLGLTDLPEVEVFRS